MTVRHRHQRRPSRAYREKDFFLTPYLQDWRAQFRPNPDELQAVRRVSDGCTCAPDRVLSFAPWRGLWVNLFEEACLEHDAYYRRLRTIWSHLPYSIRAHYRDCADLVFRTQVFFSLRGGSWPIFLAGMKADSWWRAVHLGAVRVLNESSLAEPPEWRV